MVREVIRYEAEDGTIHDDEEKARKHERRVKARKTLAQFFETDFSSREVERIVEAIMDNEEDFRRALDGEEPFRRFAWS